MSLHHYYVTFGVMYRHEKHPHWKGAHPDGWLEVIAPSYDQARELVGRYIGNVFAFMYEEHTFDRRWHPLDRLATLTAAGVWPKEGVEPPTPITDQEVPAPEVTAEHTISTATGDTLTVALIEVNHDHTPVATAGLGGTTVSVYRNPEGRVCVEIDDVAEEPVYVTINTMTASASEDDHTPRPWDEAAA